MAHLDGADVVIIGAGVTGLAAAWFLARAGVDTVVVEKGVVGYEASSRNGGICAYHRGVKGGGPMGYEETRLWHTLEEELGYPCEFVRGTVAAALDDVDMEHIKTGAARDNSLGWRTEILDSQTVREWVPIISPEIRGGWYDPDAGHANPQRTVQAYAWAVEDHGGRIYQHTKATGFKVEGNKVVAVRDHPRRHRLRCSRRRGGSADRHLGRNGRRVRSAISRPRGNYRNHSRRTHVGGRPDG